MKTKMIMLSDVPVGASFLMSDNGQTYLLLAKCEEGANAMHTMYVCRNSSPNSSFRNPFVVEGNRPVMLVMEN